MVLASAHASSIRARYTSASSASASAAMSRVRNDSCDASSDILAVALSILSSLPTMPGSALGYMLPGSSSKTGRRLLSPTHMDSINLARVLVVRSRQSSSAVESSGRVPDATAEGRAVAANSMVKYGCSPVTTIHASIEKA